MKRFVDKAAFITGAGGYIGVKCEAGDIAETVLFLCSDAARFVTGQTWAVDGGRGLGMKGSDC